MLRDSSAQFVCIKIIMVIVVADPLHNNVFCYYFHATFRTCSFSWTIIKYLARVDREIFPTVFAGYFRGAVTAREAPYLVFLKLLSFDV